MSSTVIWSVQHVFRHQTAEMEKKKKPPALQMLCEHWAKACHICKGKSIIHTQKHTSGPFDRSITDHWPTVNVFIHTLLSWHWIDGKGANWPTGQATLQPAIQAAIALGSHSANHSPLPTQRYPITETQQFFTDVSFWACLHVHQFYNKTRHCIWQHTVHNTSVGVCAQK